MPETHSANESLSPIERVAPTTSTSVPTGGHRRHLRALLPVALALVALWLSACENPAPTTVQATINNGLLGVTGTDNGESITLRLRAGDPAVIEVDLGADGTADFEFDRPSVQGILVKGHGGDDTIRVDTSNGSFTHDLPTSFLGDAGADTIVGGNGADVIAGGPGADVLEGNQGVDTLKGDAGVDVFPWDPGDGSDTLVGGADADRLVFNGSSVGEIYEMSALPDSHARLTRNVGSVVMDLDDIETVDINALGGTDIAQMNDLTGTDVAVVNANLAGFGGVDDAAVDEVVVAPGLPISRDGSAATVDGLGAQLRVVGGGAGDAIHVTGTSGSDVVPVQGTDDADVVGAIADGTDAVVDGATPGVLVRLTAVETLEVDLGDGADQFWAVGNLAALVGIDVDGGEGPDTIRGGNGADVLNGGAGDDFVDGNQGTDTADGGAGLDVFQWDPGDGIDNLVGGADADRLVFNGSGANEIYDVSAQPDGRARLTRNVASIVMDFDDIEAVDINALGGTDIAQMNDLTGTDVAVVTTNLAAFGGADDAVVDEVVVAPGLPISRDGSAATVDGLGAQVRVVGGGVGDAIHVTGTAAADVVPVLGTEGDDVVSAVSAGTDVVVDGATPGVFVRLTAIETLDVDLMGGADQFGSAGNVAALIGIDVDGGEGSDTIRGGNGPDLLKGGAGDDFIDGNQGTDTADGGAGMDVFQWDPGDGLDTLVGGADADRLVFNGSNTGEIFDVSAQAGGHVRFTRNVASIVLDLDDIETLDINALGSTDVAQVGDLSGTDMAVVNANLAGFGGVDDAAVDEVLVAPGLPISRDGSAATVGGLGAQVRVVGGGAGDAIHVTGTSGPDVVPIVGTSGADVVASFASGTDVVVDGATPGVFVRLTAIEILDVDLGDGADQFSAVGNLAALVAIDVDGGKGPDTILGGNGADLLKGGAGDDFIDGNQGTDTVSGAAGADVFRWDPGDGLDTLVGGADADRLVFNGSNTGEIFDVSAQPSGHVRFTRNVASIVLDLDDIETIDINALGGTDIAHLHDLSGTDVSAVNTNLAAFGGVDDAAADEVVVYGSPGDDQIAVVDDGPAVAVEGLAAVVRIIGAGPITDRLSVFGLEGNDTVTATPEAAALILLDLVS